MTDDEVKTVHADTQTKFIGYRNFTKRHVRSDENVLNDNRIRSPCDNDELGYVQICYVNDYARKRRYISEMINPMK